MSYLLRILPAADADVDAAAAYIARDNLDAALQFYDAVDSTCRQLRQHPKRSPIYEIDPRLTDIRKRAVAGFGNYLIFYRINDQVVEIVRVLHGARDIPAVLFETRA